MPKKKKTVKSTSKNIEVLSSLKPTSQVKPGSFLNLSKGKIIIGGLVVLVVLGLLARRYKSWVVAAIVNGIPVSRWDLNNRLTDRFGTQMLETMIGEQIIVDSANKQNVTVTQTEVEAKIAEIEKGLPKGVTLNDSLQYQGVSRTEFNRQVKLQLLIDKMLGKEVSVSAEEVDKYMADSAAKLTATDPAERKIEAEKQVRTQKISERFVEWFTKLKEAAKIQRFL